MRRAKAVLAAAAFTLPVFWTVNTVLPWVAGFERWRAGNPPGRMMFTPFGLFFSGMRMPFAFGRRWTWLAAAVAALLLVFFWRRARLANGWAIAAGAAVSLGLYGAADWSGRARAERTRDETAGLLRTLPAPGVAQPFPMLFFQRGVSFTAESGVAYGSRDSIAQLRKLPEFGVDAIALVPYGGGRVRDGKLTIRHAGPGSWEGDDGIEVLSRVAHRLAMKVMLKPHLWRSGPEIATTDDLRRQWFEQYRGFIEHYARVAVRIHADILVVGTEFGTLSSYEREWRAIVAAVRAIYPGPLTFAPTQGPEFETLAFWDALDYIGLDNYYPLPDNYSAAEVLAKVEAVQRKFNKPVILTEAGFSAVEGARRAPWEDETDKPLSLEEQSRCYDALLAAFYQKPWFHGVYWWKVGTNGYGGPENSSMTPWRKPAMEVVKKWYSSDKRRP